MTDRAMQALYLMALEPVTETRADDNSYGFRRKRSTADAIDALHRLLSRKCSPQWILEGDIKGCFDHISHQWLINHIQIDKKILAKWLTSGVVFNKMLTPTKEGTPQGGIISPTLANATLDGMEKLVRKDFPHKYLGKGKIYRPKVNLIRYADDFIVTAENKETLGDIKNLLTDFLAQRGLTLSEEKTMITHISDGFDFLGFNIRKYNGTLLIKPSKKSQKKIVEKLHEVIFSHKSVSQCSLIEMLNPVIRGWGNYFKHVVSKEVFAKIDHILVGLLKHWAFRRHKQKSKRWVINKYFKSENNRKWVFKDTFELNGDKQVFILKSLSDIPITRHVKIKKEANPFDSKWDAYFEKRSQNKSSKFTRTQAENNFIGDRLEKVKKPV
jgi:RNA-directed DNA polymerase